MTQGHWVTIDGRHVLIKSANVTGGGHQGTHNPETSTGNSHSDNAVAGKTSDYTEKEYPKLFVDPILKSRLHPALKTPSGQIKVGERGQYHWEMAPLKPGETFYPDYIRKGWKRGFVDPTTKTYYDAQKLGLDASELGTRKRWLRG